MSAESLAHHLARRMMVEGPMTVASFMAEALGHPRWGYYTAHDPFGAAGDFITAPDISQMFGELIGLWAADTWQRLGMPEHLRLIELGPGRGTLMSDALRAASALPPFRNALSVHFVETSPVLRRRQAQALAGQRFTGGGPHWHGRLEDVPDGPAIVVANEFFDALPIRQVQKTPHGWKERLVDLDPASTPDAPRFRFVLDLVGSPGAALVPAGLENAPAGSVFESSPASLAVARVLGARLAAQGGAALIIDYGHDLGPAVGETLQAVRRHAYAPVLDDPGEADITAHVDFESLAGAAAETGAVAFGPVEQGEWLSRLGIGQRAAVLKRTATPKQAADIDTALQRLIGADQMGTLFKVLALACPGLEAPAGFDPVPPT